MSAAGNAGEGGRGGRGRDGPGNRDTSASCLITSCVASLSLKSDTNLIPLLFKSAEAGEAGTGNSKLMNTLIDADFLGPDGNYIFTDLVKASPTNKV